MIEYLRDHFTGGHQGKEILTSLQNNWENLNLEFSLMISMLKSAKDAEVKPRLDKIKQQVDEIYNLKNNRSKDQIISLLESFGFDSLNFGGVEPLKTLDVNITQLLEQITKINAVLMESRIKQRKYRCVLTPVD